MAGQFLNLFLKLAVYSDSAKTLSPKLRDADWDRQFEGVVTGNDLDRRVLVPAGGSLLVASTARVLSQDATTQYTVTQPDPNANTFRFAFAGGTNPVLRTARSIGGDATTQYTVTKTGNVIRFTATGGTAPNFVTGGVVVGDQLNVESTTPAVLSPFNPLNQGVRTIVTVATSYVEVLSVDGDGVAEGPITVGSRGDSLPPFAVFSAAGVQVEDEALVQSTAFNIENRGAFEVTKVTANYFDVSNGNPGIPEGPITIGASDGVVFYPSVWKWLYLESDQKVSLRLNGDTSDHVQVEPIASSDRSQVGIYLQRGQVFSLTIANNGITPADCKVILAE